MAAINFPENPNDEDVFNGYVYDATYAVWNRQSLTLDNLSDVNATGATDGQTIIYDAASGTWIPGEGGSSFEISETAPEGAEAGDVWYNSATGKTYIYYTDVDGSQWVEIASTTMGYLDLDQLNDVNAPTPADGESLVYDSASGNWVNADATVEVYGVDTAATDYFMIPVGGDADRPVTPANGHIRFNSDSGFPEWYSAANDQWVLFKDRPSIPVQYLVIAGGGGGGFDRGGGGGAGGYRSSVSGETSGGGASAEAALEVVPGTYTVTVGAGGPGDTNVSGTGTKGFDSVFSTITSEGGGGGGSIANVPGASGGSGGGGARNDGSTNAGGSGTANQGFDGGQSMTTNASPYTAGGGGGAGEAGNTDGVGHGGDGVTSSITGSAVIRGGGGSGSNDPTIIPGGDGGGGDGWIDTTGIGAQAGDANTGGGGGGGGGAGTADKYGASGGSGVVIIKYPSSANITVDPGLVSSTSTVGAFKVTQFTDGTGDVTFS